MKLLLTGFEPFGGSSINPTEQIVKKLSAAPPAGVDLHTAILPVDRIKGPHILLLAVDTLNPDAIICLGEAGGRTAISIERVAINLMDYRIKDNAGNLVTDQPIIPDGPDAFFTTLPTRQMMEAIQAEGIPAELSLTAGAFLCNQVTYALLHDLHTSNHSHIPAGFIHLPNLPQQAAATPKRPSMSLDMMTRGITIAINILTKTNRKSVESA